jgi:hypothetical protein
MLSWFEFFRLVAAGDTLTHPRQSKHQKTHALITLILILIQEADLRGCIRCLSRQAGPNRCLSLGLESSAAPNHRLSLIRILGAASRGESR